MTHLQSSMQTAFKPNIRHISKTVNPSEIVFLDTAKIRSLTRIFWRYLFIFRDWFGGLSCFNVFRETSEARKYTGLWILIHNLVWYMITFIGTLLSDNKNSFSCISVLVVVHKSSKFGLSTQHGPLVLHMLQASVHSTDVNRFKKIKFQNSPSQAAVRI